MTPHEERLILELHSKWGNRWSRIARKLPGRTDNEIKNYWRTHMRKKAQERKRAKAPPSPLSKSSSTLSSDNPLADSIPITETKERSFYDTGGLVSKSSSTSSSTTDNPPVDLMPLTETKERSFYDTGGDHVMFGNKDQEDQVESGKGYNSMDEIWKDIALFEDTVASPLWNYSSPEMFWMMEEEESKMFPTIADPFLAFYNNQDSSNSTG